MKPLRPLLIVVAAAVIAAPAFAQPGQGRREAMRAERGAMPPFAEQMRRGYGDEPPRGAPMSAEERRQLRRDVHEAGRELYRPQRSARPREAVPPGYR